MELLKYLYVYIYIPGTPARFNRIIVSRDLILGSSKHISMPRFRIAREISPFLSSIARKIRKFGCGRTTLGFPSEPNPHSFTMRLPPVSNKGLRRSRTVGLQKFTLSIKIHDPFSSAWSSSPSIHSKQPVTWPTYHEFKVGGAFDERFVNHTKKCMGLIQKRFE